MAKKKIDTRYKVGDRVRVLPHSFCMDGIESGKIYTVRGVPNAQDYDTPGVFLSTGSRGYMYDTELELVEAKTTEAKAAAPSVSPALRNVAAAIKLLSYRDLVEFWGAVYSAKGADEHVSEDALLNACDKLTA